MNKKLLPNIKTGLSIFLVLTGLILTTGCQTVDAVISDAKRLQSNVNEKITEVKTGIESVMTEAQDAYVALIEKKKQLEEMVAEINEAVDSVNRLLGKEQAVEEKQDLQQTIGELKKALAEAEKTIAEVETAEAALEEASTEEVVEENTTSDNEETVE